MRRTITMILVLAAFPLGCQKKEEVPVAQVAPAFEPAAPLERVEPARRESAVSAPKPIRNTAVKAIDTPPPARLKSESVRTRTHTVSPNDSLYSLSRRYLGDPKRWPEIVRANPGLDPRKLRIGQKIVIPAQ